MITEKEIKGVYFIKDNNPDYLVSQVEINPATITIYGRVLQNYKKWAPEMQLLIKAVGPKVTAHDEAERSFYHPLGSAKKSYKYFHHVHSPHSLQDTLEIISPWCSDELLETLYEKDIYHSLPNS